MTTTKNEVIIKNEVMKTSEAGINDGGPAFPLPKGGATVAGTEGMSLRDYFAAKAMQSIWSNIDVLKVLPDNEEESYIAKMAYQQADAMLATREVK
jgi:hypothetical protein